MAKHDAAITERRRDARRLVAVEAVQTAVALGLVGIVAYRGITAPAAKGTSSALATLVVVELMLAVVAAVVLLGLAFRARLGRELILQEVARLEAVAGAAEAHEARGGVVVPLRHPYRDRLPEACGACPRERARATFGRR